MSSAFEQSTEFRFGKLGESVIARWLIGRGNCILPVYEKQIDEGKGPQFFTPQGEFVAPDMFVFPAMVWLEAKHKSICTWHRNTQRWTTGIDLNHYEAYKRTQELSHRRVWLLFLHRSSVPDSQDIEVGCPSECPTGLFCGNLDYLAKNENHRHSNWGRHGMVYWDLDKLTKLAELGDLENTVRKLSGQEAA